MKKKEMPSLENFLRSSYTLTKENFLLLFKVAAFFAVISFIRSFFDTSDNEMFPLSPEKYLGNSLVAIIISLITIYFRIGQVKVATLISKNKKSDLSELWSSDNKIFYVRYLFCAIVYGLMVGIGILLIVPGIYFALKYSQWQYVLVNENTSFRETFTRSASLTNGFKWQLLLYYTVFFLIVFVSALPFGLGLIFTYPMSMMVQGSLYHILVKRSEGTKKKSV